MAQHILMIVTNYGDIDSDHRTGLWLEEFAAPYETFKDQGYEVTVVSPNGGEVPVDPNSESDQWADTRKLLNDTKALDMVHSKDFDAVFLPGGHGTMFDFPDNDTLQKLIAQFYENDKVVSSVCHGPAAFTNVTLSDGRPMVSGKTITAFTNEEESGTGLQSVMPFLLESKLREQGANVVVEQPYADHIERDGNLITGQNPPSSKSTAEAVIKALEA